MRPTRDSGSSRAFAIEFMDPVSFLRTGLLTSRFEGDESKGCTYGGVYSFAFLLLLAVFGTSLALFRTSLALFRTSLAALGTSNS